MAISDHFEVFMRRAVDWFAPENIEELAVKLVLSLLVLLATYIIIKIFSRLLDKMVGESRKADEEREDTGDDRGILSDSFVRSVQVLVRTLLLYGGYFVAAIIILEIFNVKVVSAEDLKSIGTGILKIIGILVGARLVINFGHLAIKQIFQRREFKDDLIESRRAQTLEVLLRSMLTYIVFFLAALTILQIFNVNTSAILASAGILGLAVGFGAQNLVKDVLSGFFILFENQFNVGDYVETAGVVGTVEEVGLRTCKIRQWTGELHVIPNGEITRVTNYNRGPMLALVTVGIAYEEDIDQAIDVMQQECARASREIDTILDTPLVQGVTELADSSVNIRTIAPTKPGEHWAVERELLRRFKYALDRAGIEIPYPRRVLYQREESEEQ
ncbi:MAG: mechanosensitive ion channel family protein [Firmicutes bacterium]|nr:mechanosensitive ion channel family protein [Bacillota bacterium]